jgi:hypothetical protein
MLWAYIIIGQAEGFGNLTQLGAVGILISSLLAVVLALWGIVRSGMSANQEAVKTMTEEIRQLRADKDKYLLEEREIYKKIVEQATEILHDVKGKLK